MLPPEKTVALLSLDPDCYSTRRLLEEAYRQRLPMTILPTTQLVQALLPSGLDISLAGKGFSSFFGVLPRLGSSVTPYGVALLRQWQALGVQSLISPEGILLARDKWASLQTLLQAGLPVPPSVLTHPALETEALLEALFSSGGSFPVVVKPLFGSQGRGVHCFKTLKALDSYLKTTYLSAEPTLIQVFLTHPDKKAEHGRDIRCLVVGDEVVASIGRQSKPGEFRANLHLGGQAFTLNPNKERDFLALTAAKALGLSVAGIDLLETDSGLVVLEVNASPGLLGVETATGVNVAGTIITLAKKHFLIPSLA